MDVAKKKELKQLFQETGPVDVSVFVQRPFVFVVCLFDVDGVRHSTFGFAKVSRPDKWNKAYGVELAISKAASTLAKKLAAEEGDELPESIVRMGIAHDDLPDFLASLIETKTEEAE